MKGEMSVMMHNYLSLKTDDEKAKFCRKQEGFDLLFLYREYVRLYSSFSLEKELRTMDGVIIEREVSRRLSAFDAICNYAKK